VNLDRLRWGDWLAAIAAVNLLLVTFRAWYKVSGDGRVTAWHALEQGKYLLIATAIVGIFLFLVKAAGEGEKLSFKPGWIAAGVGLACTVYIAYRLVKPPLDALEADIGIYVGLISALGVTIGGLLSARESATADLTSDAVAAQDGPTTAPAVPPAANGATWSPGPPVAATSGWSPASPPVAAVPPATDSGAAGDTARPLRPGDNVVLTAAGARYPVGTLAQVVAVFGGGALVEVKAADGVADRFEVPEKAYERAPAGDSWNPAMPAAAEGDQALDGPLERTQTEDAPAHTAPWWNREIGGGKKKRRQEAVELGRGGAVGAANVGDSNASAEPKAGFLKRLFGGRKAEPATEAVEAQAPTVPEAEPTPTTDIAGTGPAAESDTAVTEPPVEAAVDAAPPEAAAQPEAATVAPAAASDAGDAQPEAPLGAEAETAAAATAPAAEPELTNTPAPTASAPEGDLDSAPAASEPERGMASDAAAAASGHDKEPARKPSTGTRPIPKELLAATSTQTQPKVGDEVQLKVGGGRFEAGTHGTVVDVFSAGVIVELIGEGGRAERLDLPFEAIAPADV